MAASIHLGKIWGIPIGLHFSWFFVFGLLVWSLSGGYFPNEYPQLSSAAHVALAVVTSLLFFGSVLAHELGHSFLALRNKIPVNSITLFIFGGVAQIGQEPRSAGAEFRIAIAGPLVSLALGVVFGVLWVLDQAIPYLAAPSLYLMRINLILAIFNMVPGFPLDGGRVLRAIIWKITGNYQRSTQIASISGQVIAFGFIGLGIFSVINGNFMNGVWLAFIGWFLQNAAASAYAQVNLQEMLRGVTVRQAMMGECNEVTGLTTLHQLVNERVLVGGQHCFFVTQDGNVQGMITLQDITSVPQPKWRFMTVDQVMKPLNRLEYLDADMQLLDALKEMDRANLSQMPVTQAGRLIGTLSREQVLNYLRLRTQLGM